MSEDGPVTRAYVDHDLCTGVTMCLQMAREGFELDETGQSVFRPSGRWTPSDLEAAADACPMAAISLLKESSASE
ncbi:MAG: ferredoxin [Streptosporangiales bacterium]|nr:ferredoxin [Streptosporangiales bacterium]